MADPGPERDGPDTPVVTVRGGSSARVPDGQHDRRTGRVGAGQAARFVVLLAPDCDLLTTRSRLAFRASLLLQVEQGGARLPLVLDMGSDRSVRRVVDGLCGRA